ncbi:MAG: hypothetical protein U0586_14375 [Candidatus Brocadiaceae bacterium]
MQLDKIELRRPREWETCWLGLYLWNLLELDTFWRRRLPSSRKGTSWLNMLKALTCYRRIDPGSEFRFYMDSGIPTGDMLEKMRSRGVDYLVGTPKGHLTHVEKPLIEQPWIQAND